MSNLISQLQDAVNELAETFCNAIGVIQQQTGPSKLKIKYNEFNANHNQELNESIFQNFTTEKFLSANLAFKNYTQVKEQPVKTNQDTTSSEKISPENKDDVDHENLENIALFSKLIAKNVKDITLLISALPSETATLCNENLDLEFKELQQKNEEAAKELEEVYKEAQTVHEELKKIIENAIVNK